MKKSNKKKSLKRNLMLSVTALVVSALLLGVSYAWFNEQRNMDTLTWIKTPIVLKIGSGNNHDIKYHLE